MFKMVGNVFKTINDCADTGLAIAEAAKVRAEQDLEEAKAGVPARMTPEEQAKEINAALADMDAELRELGINPDGLRIVK